MKEKAFFIILRVSLKQIKQFFLEVERLNLKISLMVFEEVVIVLCIFSGLVFHLHFRKYFKIRGIVLLNKVYASFMYAVNSTNEIVWAKNKIHIKG